jgi:hypothetical protein
MVGIFNTTIKDIVLETYAGIVHIIPQRKGILRIHLGKAFWSLMGLTIHPQRHVRLLL